MKIAAVRSFAHSNPWAPHLEALDKFGRLKEPARSQLVRDLVLEDNTMGVRLALKSDARFLRFLSPEDRSEIWQSILRNRHLGFIGANYVPTRQKAEDFLAAAATMSDWYLAAPRVEYLAHLMSYFTWQTLPLAVRQLPVFGNMEQSPFRAQVLSLLRDRQMRTSLSSSYEICSDMESLFDFGVNKGLATLVNDHMLFVQSEWDLSLCLQNTVSASGTPLFRGMFYFASARDRIRSARVQRMIVEDIIWSPARLANHTNFCKFDVARYHRMFLQEKR
ncbi:MAG: hypothetical protein JW782_03220 [Candidatus Saganbacteria bacterium]|nr:hypothetical protein [Candidatus Saganbacteria bacterium]